MAVLGTIEPMGTMLAGQSAAARLVAAGIDVVQDRCLLVEHRRLSG